MRIVIAAALACILSATQAAETTRYIGLVNSGKDRAGQVVIVHDGDRYRVEFIFKDNGRGPELVEQYTLGADGSFTRYHVAGTTEYGSLVDETFTRSGNKARWKSTSDEGEQSVRGTALYSPLAGTPARFDVMIAALAQRADGKLPMIPSGTLTGRTLAELEVARGTMKRAVRLIAFTGIGFSPTAVWATTDARPRLFAHIDPGYSRIIEEGWEANGPALEARQKTAEKELLVDFNARHAHAIAGATLIRNARVFDSERATLRPSSDVLIDGGRVIAVEPAGNNSLTAGRTIDAANRVLLPGLFDMHVHVGFWEGALHIGAGVTSVRDMGNDNATMAQLIAQERAGSLLMPRIVPTGFIEGESPMASRSDFVVKSLDEAKHAVDWYADHGYGQIKIYNSFPKEHLAQTAAYAHSKGLRVSGHIPVFLRARDAVLAGYDEIQHINQVLLNFLVTDTTDTRTLERFYLPAEKVGNLDFDSPEVRDFIALLADRKISIDATLATFNFLRQPDGVLSQQFAAVADHVPPDVRRGFYQAQMKIPDARTLARYEKSYAKMIEFTGRMYRAGIPLVAGTDDIAGFTLQRELELYVEAGLTPAQVLQIATYNGAKYSRVLDDRGVIAPGKRADLILVDGDPTRNISDIRKVALVVKGDVAYYPADVLEGVGVKPFTPALRMPRD